MSAGKHTPGPWQVVEGATGVSVVGANRETIFHDDKRLPSVMEDARLVAAAPDLLASLEECASWLEWLYHPDHDDLDGTNAARLKRARAAIAKAKGKQP